MPNLSLSSALRLVLAAAVVGSPAPPAQAQLAVFDPTNLIQNALTAARSLEQVTNQVKQITNQIKSLENDARNLTRLGERFTPDLVRQLRELDQLMDEAGGITLQVQGTRDALEVLFKGDYAGTEFADRARTAVQQIDATRAALRSSLMIQAKVTEQLRADQSTLERLSNASANASGSLSATQATNEILAFQAEQSMRLQSLLIAENRAQALERARAMEVQAQGRAQSAYFFAGARTSHPDAKPWN
jgi:type IV secretion system protein TrbJ